MSKGTELNEIDYDNTDGCYGMETNYEGLENFLIDAFGENMKAQEENRERFGIGIWGHPGIGKTAIVKSFANRPVTFEGKDYDGYKVYDVPIAQFEEMGDLHGMPEEHAKMVKGEDETWVPVTMMEDFKKSGYEVDVTVGFKTMYCPPDWVPTEDVPSILLLDDFNRASVRILKGIMQLLQNYGMISWKLPKGCIIVLTGNPDGQEYLVTTIDSAILTRIRHITLTSNAEKWSEWAIENDLDERGIQWALSNAEMMTRGERTNPRTLAEFFRFSKSIPDAKNNEARAKMLMHAHSLLDPETSSAVITFFQKEALMTIKPEDILDGKKKAFEEMKGFLDRPDGEKRPDIVAIILSRLFYFMTSLEGAPKEEWVRNFQNFITMEELSGDFRHNFLRRINKVMTNEQKGCWITDKVTKDPKMRKKITELVLEVMR